MLRLIILLGYIYPKGDRLNRDLLRKRSHQVNLRTSLMISRKNFISRNCGFTLKANDVRRLKEDRVAPILDYYNDMALAGQVSKESIDFFSRKIWKIETFIEKKDKMQEPYEKLLTLPGVGKTLALTIKLETGPIDRFKEVDNYSSYFREICSKLTSNGKAKENGNKINSNKFLAWAFTEEAELAWRYDEQARAYYNRKLQKTKYRIAHSTLAHKLARAAYYIMRDNVQFAPEKLFKRG